MAPNERRPGFQADNVGFQVTFPNGITVSVQFGAGNYCANYNEHMDTRQKPNTCKDAEIALFDKTGWRTREAFAALNDGQDAGDDVLSAVTPDALLEYLNWAAAAR